MKSIYNILTSCIIAPLIIIGCGSESGSATANSSTPTPTPEVSGSASSLEFVSPQLIPSLDDHVSSGYVVVENPTLNNISNITYAVNTVSGNANDVVINSNDEDSCSSVAANGRCVLKLSIPDGATASSFSLSATNNIAVQQNKLNTIKNEVSNDSNDLIGIEQVKYK